MRLIVYGAMVESGNDVQFEVDVQSFEEAEAIAQVRGVLVSRIVEAPAAQRIPFVEPPDVQTIEQTGKFWKGLLVAGFLFMLIGCPGSVVLSMAQTNETSDSSELIAVSVMAAIGMAGALMCLVSRIGGWWHHG